MMKLIIGILFFALSGSGLLAQEKEQLRDRENELPNNPTAEERELVRDVHRMFQQQDITPILSRYYKVGTDDWGLNIYRDFLKGTLHEGLERIELIRVDPPERVKDYGARFSKKWLLPVKWKLLIYAPTEGPETQYSTYNFSEYDGRIVGMASFAEDEQTPEAKGQVE